MSNAITRAFSLAERLVIAIEKIAIELHEMNGTVHHLTFDPNCETTLDRIYTILHDSLQTFDRHDEDNSGSLAAHVARIVRRV